MALIKRKILKDRDLVGKKHLEVETVMSIQGSEATAIGM